MYRIGVAGRLAAVLSLALAGCTTKPTGEAQLAVSWSALTAGWSSASPLAEQRTYHSATALPSGQVLVVGGWSYDSYLATATLYDPAADTWTPTGSLATARQAHTATPLQSGRVLSQCCTSPLV